MLFVCLYVGGVRVQTEDNEYHSVSTVYLKQGLGFDRICARIIRKFFP